MANQAQNRKQTETEKAFAWLSAAIVKAEASHTEWLKAWTVEETTILQVVR